ncbi:hypothetical protein EDB80DRAFT_883438 [Ilyonectria destructans]|nr:hypothetical protein EDB80DRAFT_883438 [Ilyonectria destructans]
MIIHALHTKEAVWVKRPDDGLQHILIVPPALSNKYAKIPRPPNAYILYRRDRHRYIKLGQPGIHNNEICEYCAFASERRRRRVAQETAESETALAAVTVDASQAMPVPPPPNAEAS